MSETEAGSVAAARVRQAGHEAGDRLRLAEEFYLPADRRRFARAELGFLRWAIARGVLNTPDAARPGSPWWRSVNDTLLRDKIEADLLNGNHREPSSRAVELWGEFVYRPSPRAWYRAHNASVVAGYLEYQHSAKGELPAERFMMNVALVRVLYAHALLARPRLALGVFAPFGPLLADPRHGSVEFFLDLRNAFPERYPLDGTTVPELLAAEGPLPHALDYGVIARKLPALYEFAAESLDQPGLAELIDDGAPCYAWPGEHRSVWHDGRAPLLTRLIAALTRTPR